MKKFSFLILIISNFKKEILSIRIKFYFFRKNLSKKLFQFEIFINLFLNRFPKELTKEANFIVKNGIWVFPYPFIYKYISREVSVFFEFGFPYVLFQGKKMFFRKGWNHQKVEKYFNDISCEQDFESPHRYCTIDFQPSKNSILLDVGTAEGNFSLEFVDKVKEVYLFERNSSWVEALNLTFSNFKDKVNIIQKNVGFSLSESNISIDDLKMIFDQELFVKIDADGSELEVLKGMVKILGQNQSMKVAICTYHKENDYYQLDEILKFYGFKTEFSNNKMLFYFDKKLKFPYFRYGVLRATKNYEFEF